MIAPAWNFYVYTLSVLRDGVSVVFYVGGAWSLKTANRINVHDATHGARHAQQFIATYPNEEINREVYAYCADQATVRGMEPRAWDEFKSGGHPVQPERPSAVSESARKKGQAVLAAGGWQCLKRGNETNAANGWREAKRALAKGRETMAASGWQNLKKAHAVHAASGWQNCKKARAAQAADGYLGLVKGRATNAASGHENLKTARTFLARDGHKNLKSGRAVVAAHAAADPEYYRKRALKAWATRRARMA